MNGMRRQTGSISARVDVMESIFVIESLALILRPKMHLSVVPNEVIWQQLAIELNIRLFALATGIHRWSYRAIMITNSSSSHHARVLCEFTAQYASEQSSCSILYHANVLHAVRYELGAH